MMISNIIIILILYLLSYIFNYYIIQYISVYVYTSLLSNILLILIIDSYNLILERDSIYNDYIKLSKELKIISIENDKLHKIIKNI